MKAQYKALIKDTLLKELRSKTLIFLFIATTLSIVLGHFALTLLNSYMGKDPGLSLTGVNVLTFNFRILNSTSFIIAVIFGVSTFRSDFHNNVIYQYLAFPISRTEYFFLRILGSWLLVLAYYTYAYTLSTILFSIAFKKIVLTPEHLYGFLVLGIYLLLVIFIATFFSLFMNKVGALLSTFFSAILSSFAYSYFSVQPVKEYFLDLNGLKSLGLVIYLLFPRISFLSEMSSELLANGGIGANAGYQLGHLIAVGALYVYMANWVVNKKNF